MISLIKEQLGIWRLKKNLRAHTQPDRAFLKSARSRFATMAQQRAGATAQVKSKHSQSWRYATVAIIAVLSMTSGIVVFADANNVPANHPLYGFKRLSEQIRLDLSSPVEQIELHKTFAQRRLEEASELKTDQEINQQASPEVSPRIDKKDNQEINPKTSPEIIPNSNTSELQNRIDELNKDFQDETDHVLDQIKNPLIKTEARVQFCQDILNTIKDKSDSDRVPTQMVDHIKSRCGGNERDRDN